MEAAQNCFFRDQLRSAWATALADAEGFHAVLRVLELIGQQLGKTIKGLGDYKPMLSRLASASPLAADFPCQWPGYHTAFDALYDEMRQARNDAVHQGAYARTLTDHAVELSIILEDALMTKASKCSQFMVRNVVDAKPWHPVSYVRQQMLTYAIPIWHHDAWKLILNTRLHGRVKGLELRDSLNVLLYRADVRASIIERPTVSQNSNLFSAVIGKLRQSFEGNKKLFERASFRRLMREINSVGGAQLLDAMAEEQIGELIDVIVAQKLGLSEL